MNRIVAVIISDGKKEYLKQNIDSLIKYKNNIFVVLNGKNQQIIDWLTITKKEYKKLDFFVFDKKVNRAEAGNAGIEKVKADILYFLYEDVFVDIDNIQVLRNKFKKYPKVGIIGGPNLTAPNSSNFQHISGIMLSKYLMTYKMSSRYSDKGLDRITDDKELMLCNLAIKKKFLTEYDIKFNNILNCNEENLLLEQLKKQNVKMLFCPELKVYCHRKKDMKSFLLQIYSSGNGRGIISVIMPSSMQPYFFFPSMFVMYLLLLLFGGMPLILFYVYLIVMIYNVITVYVRYKLKPVNMILMFMISISSHVYYGIGFITGLIKGLIWKKKKIFEKC